MLTVESLHHRYDGTGGLASLRDVSLSVGDGELVCVIGPSGCGKSTLLRVIAGLLRPTSGSVRLDGRSVAGQAGSVAYMPQQDQLLPWRRALDNAVLAAEVHGVERNAARLRAAAAFERFGLAGFEQAWPDELSGGMRQRLALLRTYLADRPLLLLDEPFGALDAITRRSMQSWLQERWLADRRSMLLVTHDVDEAVLLADRVLVMSSRPGTVAATHALPEPRPRAAADVTAPWFVRHKAALLAQLESAGESGTGEGASA